MDIILILLRTCTFAPFRLPACKHGLWRVHHGVIKTVRKNALSENIRTIRIRIYFLLTTSVGFARNFSRINPTRSFLFLHAVAHCRRPIVVRRERPNYRQLIYTTLCHDVVVRKETVVGDNRQLSSAATVEGNGNQLLRARHRHGKLYVFVRQRDEPRAFAKVNNDNRSRPPAVRLRRTRSVRPK